MNRLVDAATGRTGRGLIFSGTAGIGKSRLLRESLAALPPAEYAVHAASANAATPGSRWAGWPRSCRPTRPPAAPRPD